MKEWVIQRCKITAAAAKRLFFVACIAAKKYIVLLKKAGVKFFRISKNAFERTKEDSRIFRQRYEERERTWMDTKYSSVMEYSRAIIGKAKKETRSMIMKIKKKGASVA